MSEQTKRTLNSLLENFFEPMIFMLIGVLLGWIKWGHP